MKTPSTLPWRKHQMEHDSIVQASTGFAICWVNGKRFTEEKDGEYLEYILEAVNQHAALLDENRRLRETLTEIKNVCEEDGFIFDENVFCEHIATTAKQALGSEGREEGTS